MKLEFARMPMTAPFQSKLIPHEDFIRQCRMKRWSYPRIAKALQEEHGVKTGASTIFEFVKVRAKKRHVYELPPNEEPSNFAGGGFFEPAPDQTRKPNELKKPKWNIDL